MSSSSSFFKPVLFFLISTKFERGKHFWIRQMQFIFYFFTSSSKKLALLPNLVSISNMQPMTKNFLKLIKIFFQKKVIRTLDAKTGKNISRFGLVSVLPSSIVFLIHSLLLYLHHYYFFLSNFLYISSSSIFYHCLFSCLFFLSFLSKSMLFLVIFLFFLLLLPTSVIFHVFALFFFLFVPLSLYLSRIYVALLPENPAA